MPRIKHNQAGGGQLTSPEYRCWQDIKARCPNPRQKYFAYYGGRGIKICDRWRNSFENFFADVGKRPTAKHTIDRHPNNDGNYEPTNVRWATRMEQVANRRSTRFVTLKGKKIPLTEACRMLGIERKFVTARIERGWTPEDAINTPRKWTRPDLRKEQ